MKRILSGLAGAVAVLAAGGAQAITYTGTTTDGFYTLMDRLEAGGKYRTELTISAPVWSFGTNILRYHDRDVYFADTGKYFYGFDSELGFIEDVLYYKREGLREVATYVVPSNYLEYSETHDFPDKVNIEHFFEGWLFLDVYPGEDSGPVSYTLRIERVPAVPEPVSWAMMVSGLALAGALLRRRPSLIVS